MAAAGVAVAPVVTAAARRSHRPKLLEREGMYVSVLDEEDRTPLLLAVKGIFGKEVASALIRAGADPNTPAGPTLMPRTRWGPRVRWPLPRGVTWKS